MHVQVGGRSTCVQDADVYPHRDRQVKRQEQQWSEEKSRFWPPMSFLNPRMLRRQTLSHTYVQLLGLY